MSRFVRWIRRFVQELRRRRVIRVAVVYATTAFVVLQLAEILADPFGLGSWAIRLVTFLLVLGFPLAIGLAWVYNLTEEGLVRAEVEAEGEIGPEGKPLTSNAIIIGLLALAVGLLLYPRVFSSGEEVTGQASPTRTDTTKVAERSIAVLPFEPLSSGEESRTFARGSHDDLLTRLANISDLKVISRTAVERYRDTELTTNQIADSLGVRWILEGGVQVLGDQIQVNAQLIDPRTETHAWAENYQRALTTENLFAIQGKITGEIAEALKAQLTAGEQSRVTGAPTENLDAYRLYVRGRQLLASRAPDSIRQAQRLFERALAEDSTYSRAWAGLADAHVLHNIYIHGPDAPVEEIQSKLQRAREAATRARDLDPSLAEAWAALGAVRIQWRKTAPDRGVNGPAALKALLRAVELKPSSANAQQWLGELYCDLGRPEQGLKHASLAVDLDPKHVGARRVLVMALIANGRAEEAWRHVQRLPPGRRGGFADLALYETKQWEKLQRAAREYLKKEGGAGPRWVLARIAALRGDTTRARNHLAKVSQQDAPFMEGLTHAALGDADATFSAWEKTVGQNMLWGRALRYYFSDILDPLREDPRYEALIREINEYWGLNPDGSIPDSVGVSLPSSPEADA